MLHNDGDTDVALVTNIDVPTTYRQLLDSYGVQIIRVDFNDFNFGKQYSWGLAFYKLCALYNVVRQTQYKCYALIDSDVYIQNHFENIWRECHHSVLMYDINCGLDSAAFLTFEKEMKQLRGGGDYTAITYYGGEFFAANRNDALIFSDCCKAIFDEMQQKQFRTERGDEFISTLAAHTSNLRIKNAAPYVFRFWTGRYRVIKSTSIRTTMPVLHCPGEKMHGMLTLYSRYIVRHKHPSQRSVWRILHISRPRFIIIIYLAYRSIIDQIMQK